jgi:hypothetical protein
VFLGIIAGVIGRSSSTSSWRKPMPYVSDATLPTSSDGR